jgi:hypothetical protein
MRCLAVSSLAGTTPRDVGADHAGATDNAFVKLGNYDVLYGAADNTKGGGRSRHDGGLLLHG